MNLLDHSVLTVRTPNGPEMCSLPRIYSLLAQDAVEGFAKLQSHQKQAWHAFLAQLGAIATEQRDVPSSEEEWRKALTELAPQEAWNLWTPDLSKPAFMQPPVPEGTVEGFSEIHPTEYDVPVLSKSHALKLRRMRDPSPEHWIYLLVNVQTTGFYSPGGRRASRMNGSYASRPFFGLTPSLRLGPWLMHDIQVLRQATDEIEQRYGYQRNLHPLVWTIPWDGTDSIDLEELHPLYIDCARRIRRNREGSWLKETTRTERITGDVNGQTGDPWAPVDLANNKVLNPGRAAFQYRQLWQILFGTNYRRPASLQQATDGYVVCRAVTGEQGGRVHDLQRVIPFSNTELGNPFTESEDAIVAEEARWRVQRAEKAAEVLSHALFLLLKEQADSEDTGKVPDLLQQGKNRQLRALHNRIDQRFFERLFDAPNTADEERWRFWETVLVEILRQQWDEAKGLCPDKNRWERLARSTSLLQSRIYSTFTYADQTTNTYSNGQSETEKEEVGQPHARPMENL